MSPMTTSTAVDTLSVVLIVKEALALEALPITCWMCNSL